MPGTAETTYFAIGTGNIDPGARIADGEITEAGIADCVEYALSDCYDSIDSFWITGCVDGRGQEDGQQTLGANAAGGTYTLVVADALTNGRYRKAGQQSHEHAATMFAALKQANVPIEIRSHGASHAEGENCGCAACDKLDSVNPVEPSILKKVAQAADPIRAYVEDFGIYVSDEVHQLVTASCTALISEHYAGTGKQMREAVLSEAGAAASPILGGDHNECRSVINFDDYTTLNRLKLAKHVGDAYQLFNVDVWAIEKSTEAISVTEDEAYAKFIAGMYYNLATAGTIAAKSLLPEIRGTYQGKYRLSV